MYWIFIIEIEIELASEVDIKYQSRIVNRKPILIFQFLVFIYLLIYRWHQELIGVNYLSKMLI